MDSKDKKQQGTSVINVESGKFTWIITNFSMIPVETKHLIRSPDFEIGTRTVSVWELWINVTKKGMVQIFLRKLEPSGEHKANFTICILDVNGHPFKSVNIVHAFKEDDHPTWCLDISFDDLLKEKETVLPNDTLTVVCELKVVARIYSVAFGDEESEADIKLRSNISFFSNLNTMYKDGNYSDFTLQVEDQILPVHKVILAGRSPVFAAMFDHNMSEKSENRAVISDIPVDVMKVLMVYLYTGQVAVLTESLAVGLYKAANKYAIEGLKKICRQYIVSHLAADNVHKVLHLAFMYSDTALKTTAKLFWRLNPISVVNRFELHFDDMKIAE